MHYMLNITKERIRGATLSETRTAKTSSTTFCTVDTNTHTRALRIYLFFPPQVLREYAHIIVPRHSPHPFEVEACTLRDPSRVTTLRFEIVRECTEYGRSHAFPRCSNVGAP